MHGVTGFVESAALLVFAAFVLVTICSRIGLPSIVGYILAGIVIGPGGLGLIAESAALSSIGEIGVVLLLFALGLEFSFEKLARLRKHVFGLGAAQVAVTTITVSLIASLIFDLAPVPAILVGGAVAMSSTAMCLKVLASANALGSAQGRVAIAVLLFQDLAAVAFLLLHDSMSGTAEGYGVITVVAGATALVAALFIARGPLQVLTRWVASRGDPELAQLLALTIALGSAIVAASAGLSPALAAFAAGMIIGEGDSRHTVENEIRPFRDLFVGIFFVGIGTQLPLWIIPSAWPVVLIWFATIVAGKSLIVLLVAKLFGEAPQSSWRTGIILAHGGEFSLMLLSVSSKSGIVPEDFAGPLFLAIGMSMLIGSFMVRWAGLED
ncbi:Kef-type K+ transport system, membrane component [Rubellimicrobium thermophilum DSM 16684]|uniref:Kef-type K+ transport system, membrane component n=1 Tax=Rubellimicrobium thermophilum DSM 16684 TaxID=1123069 RepID=S9R214_9RHOB|nr:cation:proton antiporter [Rubellimicrobium thermophilum]EPX87691.1 Kef-type K+ transport system, membrane component [Rubellimicrobium thermophilum DSM 16684]